VIREAGAGRDVVGGRNGRRGAKSVAWPPARGQRVWGSWAGRIRIRDDIVGADEESNALFEQSALDDPS